MSELREAALSRASFTYVGLDGEARSVTPDIRADRIDHSRRPAQCDSTSAAADPPEPSEQPADVEQC
ncbi:hypothetical protein [Amycolatopsis sp. cmx-8-4]|uniref:hypothetical protein n=1 Tax=Amycolatopsis sp. cmx-8-4 TaxID=2790947 RepID=UPI003978DCB4